MRSRVRMLASLLLIVTMMVNQASSNDENEFRD